MATDIKDASQPLDASALIGLLPAPPRILALGEPTHGEDALLRLRNDLFRQLVERYGYRTIALETDCLRGLAVDAHVTPDTGGPDTDLPDTDLPDTGGPDTGDLDAVMEHGFSHGWGALAANRELVRWMRAHNEGRPASEQVRFAGFDGPLEIEAAASPRQALTALHRHLAAHLDADLLPCAADTLDRLLGPDDAWTEPAAMYDAARSVGRSDEARELRLLADDLVALLDTQAPRLRAAVSPGDHERALLYGRTATGLLRYHHAMADPSPARLTRLAAERDRMMAHNLLALAGRGPVLVYSHNTHLQREESAMRMGGGLLEWWGAGALVASRLGREYAFVATALGTITHRGVDAPPPDTVEGLLYDLPEDRHLVDPGRLAAALGGTPPAPRESPWFGYAPFDPAHLGSVDGLVYVRDVPRG
ncbi:erythromycin esterase family protein [Streptomyces sp. enrichment culture]|uniref:erythromycin esterase family protein n=1 Tax=Streptomyces sp. enrichment culture TaxID=1795815 RepID=UPI003F55293F